MDATRARFLTGSALVVGILTSVGVAPAAAATCTLQAPATVVVGQPFIVQGTGFPASSSIDVVLTVQGGSSDEFAVLSGDAGSFRIESTPETADIGTTTVTATAGTACSAQTVYVVSAKAPAPTPAATRPPRVASGGASSPPRTDAAAARVDLESNTNVGSLALAIVLVMLGLTGLVGTRRAVRP